MSNSDNPHARFLSHHESLPAIFKNPAIVGPNLESSATFLWNQLTLGTIQPQAPGRQARMGRTA
jgi:hypothetical protein